MACAPRSVLVKPVERDDAMTSLHELDHTALLSSTIRPDARSRAESRLMHNRNGCLYTATLTTLVAHELGHVNNLVGPQIEGGAVVTGMFSPR
jgi:hypothetical protein